MSIREILAGGGGVKSIQTGYVDSTSPTTGTGEDNRHVNVTISAVSSMAKCVVTFDGSGATNSNSSGGYSAPGTSSDVMVVTARLTSTTNLRLGTKSVAAQNAGGIAGRWTVVEYQ